MKTKCLQIRGISNDGKWNEMHKLSEGAKEEGNLGKRCAA